MVATVNLILGILIYNCETTVVKDRGGLMEEGGNNNKARGARAIFWPPYLAKVTNRITF